LLQDRHQILGHRIAQRDDANQSRSEHHVLRLVRFLVVS
jgi:hypothetical protein